MVELCAEMFQIEFQIPPYSYAVFGIEIFKIEIFTSVGKH